MRVNNEIYKSIWCDDAKKIWIIDQTLLPFEFKVKELSSFMSAVDAISNMQVRGAPLIGVTAAYGLYLAIKESPDDKSIHEAGIRLIETRPTAVNLKWAVEKITLQVISMPKDKREKISLQIAQNLSNEDEATNEKIGYFGSKIIEDIYNKTRKPVNILTHCNAGWLATVDWGTATSPIYKSRDNNIPLHIWVDETRPRNQGSFLTSWELKNEKIEHTIITDNTGGHLMLNGMVDLVITGSDRTTYTGDVCNKIGTYLKALAANENKIPFYVALPSSTIDWKIENGKNIQIEKRSPSEIHYISGLDADGNIKKIRLTPENTDAENFAFDVTPRKYITGLITEFGILKPNKKDIMKIYKD